MKANGATELDQEKKGVVLYELGESEVQQILFWASYETTGTAMD